MMTYQETMGYSFWKGLEISYPRKDTKMILLELFCAVDFPNTSMNVFYQIVD